MDSPFQPNEHQLAYLRACLDGRVAANVEARCRAAGISRPCYYLWMRQEGFADWLASERRRAVHDDLPDVIAAIARHARNGSLPHAKLFLQVAGIIDDRSNLVPDNPLADVTVNVPRPR